MGLCLYKLAFLDIFQNWCKLKCGEEDWDWKVVKIPGKGFGVVAVRDIPAKVRIMVDRAYTQTEAWARPQIMDLCPIDATFDKKFEVNKLVSQKLGKIVCLRYSGDLNTGRIQAQVHINVT